MYIQIDMFRMEEGKGKGVRRMKRLLLDEESLIEGNRAADMLLGLIVLLAYKTDPDGTKKVMDTCKVKYKEEEVA